MYYNNSFQQSNNYYNAYKEELKRVDKQQNHQLKELLLKLSLSILMLGLIAALAVFIINFFTQDTANETSLTLTNTKEIIKKIPIKHTIIEEKLERIKLSKIALPKSIQLQKYINEPEQKLLLRATDTLKKPIQQATSISPKEVALIVQIIMTQMQESPKSKLEQELKVADNSHRKSKQQSLSEVNHYNKIILSSNNLNAQSSSELEKLRVAMNQLIDEPVIDKVDPEYTSNIQKEIAFRSNEMRVIVVKQGDTLSRIAKKAYGDYDAYPKLYKANPEIIQNPNQIFVGQRLRIPV